MLMAYAGFRPSEIMRAQSEDVLPYLDLPESFCFKRVGKGGVPVMVPLPREGVAAWRLLIARRGWGRFQSANINRDWKQAMTRAREAAVSAALESRADAQAVERIRVMFRPVNRTVCVTVSRCAGFWRAATRGSFRKLCGTPRLDDGHLSQGCLRTHGFRRL
jgi:hypothetical protein